MHTIYEIKIELEGMEPEIWRKIQLPGIVKLHKLHEVIQIAMGWTNSHLHMFRKDNKEYMDPELDDEGYSINERRIKLEQMLTIPGDTFIYEYDFGDSWIHKISLVKILESDIPMKRAVCIGGKNACPPEDVGGIGGYAYFLDAIEDTEHEEHHEYLEWIGGKFDSRKFSLKECNKFLQMINLTRKQYLYFIMLKRFRWL
jgi:hypothetical protein